MDDPADNVEQYDTDGSVRNLCLVWEDGRKAFFNYAYLISVDLVLSDTVNVIVLSFSGHIITLKGYQLDVVFGQLLNHTPKILKVINPRYYQAGSQSLAVVVEATVKRE